MEKFDSKYIYKRDNVGPQIKLFAILVLVTVLSFGFPQQSTDIHGFNGLKYFNSYEELSNFVKSRSNAGYSQYGFGDVVAQESSARTTAGASGTTSTDYSTTNIQVAGVDEPDIVKNDGKYIYTVSNGKILILDAYPPESAKILSKINFGGYISEIFVNKDKLIVFGNDYSVYTLGYQERSVETVVAGSAIYPYYSSGTVVLIYDMTDRSNPVLERNISFDGNFFDARMIDDYIYVVSIQPVNLFDGGPVLPAVRESGNLEKLSATEVGYFDVYDESLVYTNILALSSQNKNEEPILKSFLTGYSQNIYVSAENIYLTYTKWLSYKETNKRILENAILPNLPLNIQNEIREIQKKDNNEYEISQEIQNIVSDYARSLEPERGAELLREIQKDTEIVQIALQKEQEKTVIHKISISKNNVDYKSSGDVPGNVLNQFSMDEYRGNFRIATTAGNWDSSFNNVYILDPNLNIIGKLEDLAFSERIYSARFLGDKAFLVTFRQVDPLFVLDLSNPYDPKLSGELKVPGFSNYLHPFDERYLIGIGEETDSTGRRTGQIKLSLFDVNDVSNPKEVHKYLVGDELSYAYSEALYDHKAFLFSKPRNLLVIPINTNQRIVADNGYSYDYRQSAYVFEITPEAGFNLRGTIAHDVTTVDDQYYYSGLATVRRSLYIENILYTISDTLVKANYLTDLSFAGQVNLTG